MSVHQEAKIEQFQKIRNASVNAPICYAPSISLNFDQSGSVTACCFNRKYELGKYPEQSLQSIWNGEKIKELRNALHHKDLSLGCQLCEKYIDVGNYHGSLIKHFDDHAALSPIWKGKDRWWKKYFHKNENTLNVPYPVMLEFEISNQCNLECIMCGGKWSSAIRKNREHLPSIQSPYDKKFVDEVKQFLPTLKRANFLGGEPFLVSIYQDIWQDIVEINPFIEVAITTNGTVLNTRAKKILEHLQRCVITLSLDSLKKETWENIRRNGDFEILRQNIDWLLLKKKVKSVSVCPMIQNRYEIPEIIQFCIQHDLDIFFNIVEGPLGGKIEGIHYSENKNVNVLPEVSIKELSENELISLEDFYLSHKFKGKYSDALNGLIHQVRHWRTQKSVYA